jgi:hypothetical protein
MKDIIKPTIRSKFRGLHMWSKTITKMVPPYYDEAMSFRDDDDNEFINYNHSQNELWVDYNYFMLHYFGISKKDNEIVKEIFIDLLNDYFESMRENIVVNKDVRFKFYII